MFTKKTIDINPYNVNRFIEKYGDASIQKFCNDVIEKIIDEKIIELTEDNFTHVKKCALQLNKDTSFVINSVLERFDIVALVKPEKIKVEITAHTQQVKTIKKLKTNEVVNWK